MQEQIIYMKDMPRGISIVKVQAPTWLKPQYIYELRTSNDLHLNSFP